MVKWSNGQMVNSGQYPLPFGFSQRTGNAKGLKMLKWSNGQMVNSGQYPLPFGFSQRTGNVIDPPTFLDGKFSNKK